jgi:hypothetical protein
LRKRRLVQQQVAAGALQGVLVDADTHGGIALRVHVDEQHAALQRREGRGEVDGVVVLPTPPFWFAMAMMRAMGILRMATTEAADGVGQYLWRRVGRGDVRRAPPLTEGHFDQAALGVEPRHTQPAYRDALHQGARRRHGDDVRHLLLRVTAL